MVRFRLGLAAPAAAVLALILAPAQAMSKPKLRLFETFSSTSKAAPEPHLQAADDAVPANPRDAAEIKTDEPDVDLPHLPGATLPSFDTAERPAEAAHLVEVAKVLELPDTPEFQREDGGYVDLGWRNVGKTGGRYVGYIGSPTEYLTISPEQLAGIMATAKLTALPEPPKRLIPKTQTTAGESSPPDVGWTMLLTVGAMALYARYLIQKAAWNAAGQFGDIVKQAAAALSLKNTKVAPAAAALPSSQPARRAARAGHPAASRQSTVVRGSPSLFSRRA